MGALLARAGYWTGEATFRKPDYDTHENQSLVDLNKRMLRDLGVGRDYEHRFRSEDLRLAEQRMDRVDWGACRTFLAHCEKHRPWVWKDPRLWITVRIWSRILDLSAVRLVVVDRDPLQQWVAMTLRRQIQTYGHASAYNAGILGSIDEFLSERGLSFLRLRFEDLIRDPDAQIRRLNEHLGTRLEVADLQAVYRGMLYRNPRGIRDALKALAIYAKNYASRRR